MTTDKGNTGAPTLMLVSNAPRLQIGREAADELIEDVIRVLSLLETFAYVEDGCAIDPKAAAAAASMLVEKLRRAQRFLNGEV